MTAAHLHVVALIASIIDAQHPGSRYARSERARVIVWDVDQQERTSNRSYLVCQLHGCGRRTREPPLSSFRAWGRWKSGTDQPMRLNEDHFEVLTFDSI